MVGEPERSLARAAAQRELKLGLAIRCAGTPRIRADLVVFGLPRAPPFAEPLEEYEEHGNEEDRQHGGGDHPAENGDWRACPVLLHYVGEPRTNQWPLIPESVILTKANRGLPRLVPKLPLGNAPFGSSASRAAKQSFEKRCSKAELRNKEGRR